MMGGNRGKEIPTSIANMSSSSQQQQHPINILHGTSLSTTPTIQIIQDNTAQSAATENFSNRIISILPLQNMMDMQSSFAQLPNTQRREFLSWMLSNLNNPEVDMVANEIQSKQPPTQTNMQDSKIKTELSSNAYRTTASHLWTDSNKIEQGSVSINPSQQVLTGITVQGLPYSSAPVSHTSGSTISYVPVVASVSGSQDNTTAGVTYGTPVYSSELVAQGDNIAYVHPVNETNQHTANTQVIGHISELQGNREINIVLPSSQAVKSNQDSTIVSNEGPNSSSGMITSGGSVQQIIDAEGVVTNVMYMPETAHTLEEDTETTSQPPMIVIKQIEEENRNPGEVEAENASYSKQTDASLTTDYSKSPQKLKKSKRWNGRRSPCLDCKKYFQLVPDETKKGRVWREKTHLCNQCNKIFRTKAHLKVHERIHSGLKPFACSHCNKKFAQSSAAKAHCLLHTCHICNKQMTTKGNLKLHMALHSGQKPFECSMCSKTFPRKSNLDQHLLTHTGEKPYSCELCGKAFRTTNAKKTHERIHTGEKPYQCQYCLKSFSDRRNWKSHERIHTGGFSCKQCGKHFSDRRRVKSHLCPVELKKTSSPSMLDMKPTQILKQEHLEQPHQLQPQIHSLESLSNLPTVPHVDSMVSVLPSQHVHPTQITQLTLPEQHQQPHQQHQQHQQQQHSNPSQQHQIVSM